MTQGRCLSSSSRPPALLSCSAPQPDTIQADGREAVPLHVHGPARRCAPACGPVLTLTSDAFIACVLLSRASYVHGAAGAAFEHSASSDGDPGALNGAAVLAELRTYTGLPGAQRRSAAGPVFRGRIGSMENGLVPAPHAHGAADAALGLSPSPISKSERRNRDDRDGPVRHVHGPARRASAGLRLGLHFVTGLHQKHSSLPRAPHAHGPRSGDPPHRPGLTYTRPLARPSGYRPLRWVHRGARNESYRVADGLHVHGPARRPAPVCGPLLTPPSDPIMASVSVTQGLSRTRAAGAAHLVEPNAKDLGQMILPGTWPWAEAAFGRKSRHVHGPLARPSGCRPLRSVLLGRKSQLVAAGVCHAHGPRFASARPLRTRGRVSGPRATALSAHRE